MAPQPNSKYSFKSTWRMADRSNWTIHHWTIEILKGHAVSGPVHSKYDKVPFLPQWPQQLWVLFHALVTVAIHQSWLSYTKHQGLGKFPTFILYLTLMVAIVIRELQLVYLLGRKYGFLDGDVHRRDDVPDVGVVKVTTSLFMVTAARVTLMVYFAYDPGCHPMEFLGSWQWWPWLALKIGLYLIVLDFWFYWYHRAMHDVAYLWKYHRMHHLSKHPISALTIYADHEQVLMDVICVPLMAYATLRVIGLPLGFYDWWICQQYAMFAEIIGHSGLRIHMTCPTPLSWLLKMFQMDMVIEDHDLHHRKGSSRESHNYGKQSRLWDRLFGTCGDRIEDVETNVDFANPVTMPIFWYI